MRLPASKRMASDCATDMPFVYLQPAAFIANWSFAFPLNPTRRIGNPFCSPMRTTCRPRPRDNRYLVARLDEKRDGGMPDDGKGFSFLEEKQGDEERERIDRRTRKLANAWSNDIGFLVGIFIVVLIGAFYFYVYSTGGI